MNKKQIQNNPILREVIVQYFSSKDYNGLPIYQMGNYDYEKLCTLIDDNWIEVLSAENGGNPHIKGVEIHDSPNEQKRYINNCKNHAVIYPSVKTLTIIDSPADGPYSKIMALGSPQFKLIFFNIEILERYVNNPKFAVIDDGYGGRIFPKGEHANDPDIEDEYIKNYGTAYIAGANLNRAVGVFVVDLAKRSTRTQLLWKYYELPDQSTCKIARDFVTTLLDGKWLDRVWGFDALLEVMRVIDDQCNEMGIPKLFRKNFPQDHFETPDGYRNILLPTIKNFNHFLLALEKMLVDNISIDTFCTNSISVKSIERYKKDGTLKGSLVMLEEWLVKNIRTKDDLSEAIVKPLKKIRRLRQGPAHKLQENQYDIQLYQKQHELMEETFAALIGIMSLFSCHPKARVIKIPSYLKDGEVVFY